MTDKEKLDKVRAEIERRLKGLSDGCVGQRYAYQTLLSFMDSMQEEQVSGNIDFEQELYKAFGQVKDFTLGMQIAKWFYDMGRNSKDSQEPVSEDLNEAANNYVLNVRKGYPRVMDETDRYIYNAFKAGAQWQLNRLQKQQYGK